MISVCPTRQTGSGVFWFGDAFSHALFKDLCVKCQGVGEGGDLISGLRRGMGDGLISNHKI